MFKQIFDQIISKIKLKASSFRSEEQQSPEQDDQIVEGVPIFFGYQVKTDVNENMIETIGDIDSQREQLEEKYF